MPSDTAKERWRWPEWTHLVVLLITVASATYYLGSELSGVKAGLDRVESGVKADVAGVQAGLDRVKADVAGVVDRMEAMETRMEAMETRMVALFADQLRDNRRDVADMRERISALEAGAE